MTREEAIEVIKEMAIPEVKREIQYRLDTFFEEEENRDADYDYMDAFVDSSKWFEEDKRGKESINCIEIEIKLGVWQEVTDEDLENVFVTHGHKWDLRYNRKKYVFKDQLNNLYK
ncbi:MAG: hypothetical protein GF375_03495 [Candidatus Omnitrophica bacterium]|nr:hypothetical protein [Candidatus Omnitrophota bacterium]